MQRRRSNLARIPTCLRGDGHVTTISSALNRADRLSSYDGMMLELPKQHELGRVGIELIAYSHWTDDPDLNLPRFNIIGSELEAAAHSQL